MSALNRRIPAPMAGLLLAPLVGAFSLMSHMGVAERPNRKDRWAGPWARATGPLTSYRTNKLNSSPQRCIVQSEAEGTPIWRSPKGVPRCLITPAKKKRLGSPPGAELPEGE